MVYFSTVAHLMLMSALYFFPLTMPSRVGFCLSLKFSVTSYTAFTVETEQKHFDVTE